MNSNKIRQAFFEDPEVMAMLDVKDRTELVDKVNRISTPDLAMILKGDKGEPGEPAHTPTNEELIALIEPLIPNPIPGKSIVGPPGESIIGPPGPAGKDSISTHTKETITEEVTIDDKFVKKVIAVMSKLPEKHKLDISSLRNAGSFLFNGKRYKTEELMHGSGTSSSSSSLKTETPTGTIDDSNTTFTVIHEPFYINVNGAEYFVGTGLYTSYLAGTITLASPVGTGGFIRSVYQS